MGQRPQAEIAPLFQSIIDDCPMPARVKNDPANTALAPRTAKLREPNSEPMHSYAKVNYYFQV